MLSGPQLQWGTALRWQHPLLSLLAAPRPGQLISRLAHPVAVTALTVWTTPDSQQPPLVLSADADGRLKLWAVGEAMGCTALRRVAAHLLHSGAITCLEPHPPSELLATAGYDGAVRLWRLSDLVEGQAPTPRGCLVGHGSAVSATAFSACGGFLASCSKSDGTVRLWSVADREQLCVLRLPASSVTFAPGDAAALLVAGPSLPPQLVDLRRVPACQQYCRCLKLKAGQQNGSCGGGSRCMAVGSAASSALHPAAAMWLPGSPLPSSADLPVRTPGQHSAFMGTAAADAGPSNPQPGRSGALASPRQAGSLVEFSRKRQRNGREQRGGGQGSPEAAAPSAATPRSSTRAMSSCSWLPGSDSPRCLRAAASSGCIARGDGSSGNGFPAWSVAMPPASPLASPAAACSEDDCAVPKGALLAQWHVPPADASGKWDTRQQCFVYQQGGHTCPVQWLLPLPGGLHVLTISIDGEGKLWSTSAGGTDAVCGTLVPAVGDRRYSVWSGCQPALSCCGQYAVSGGLTGTLAAWDLAELQRQVHLPLSGVLRDGNAAVAAAVAHPETVTAVAVGAGDTLLASGDASGRLIVRWM